MYIDTYPGVLFLQARSRLARYPCMDIPRLAAEEELEDEPIPPDYPDDGNVDIVMVKDDARGFLEEEANSSGNISPKVLRGAGMNGELELSHADEGAEKSDQTDATLAKEPKISQGKTTRIMTLLTAVDNETQSASEGVGRRRRRRKITESSGGKQPLSPVRDDALRQRNNIEWPGSTTAFEHEGYDDKWSSRRVSLGTVGGISTKRSVGGDRVNNWGDGGVSHGEEPFVDSSMALDASRMRRKSEFGGLRHISGMAEMSPVAVAPRGLSLATAVSDGEARISCATECTGAGDIAGGVAAAKERIIRGKEDELVPVYHRTQSRRIRNRRRSRTWGTAADKDDTEKSTGGIWGFQDASFDEDSEGGNGDASASKGNDDGDQDFDPGDEGAVVVEDEKGLGLDDSGGLNGELRMETEFVGLPSLVTPTVRQNSRA